MDYSDKIARYQEIERRGLLNQLPIEKQEAWAEYKRRQAPELSLTDEQKAKIKATNDEYARRQAERDSNQWFVSLVENQQDDPLKKFARSTARLGMAGVQGIANAGLNPFSEPAKAMGADLKPIKPETSAERMAELAGEYGYDAAVLRALGGIAEGAGYLGEGISGASRVAKAVLAPEGGLKSFVAPAIGSAFVRGYTDPRNPFEGFLADVAGAASVGGLQSALAKDTKQVAGGLKNILKDNKANAAISKAIKNDETIAQQVTDDAPKAFNQLNSEMENALEKATGRQINVGRALENQQERMNEYIGRNADISVYDKEKLAKLTQGLDEFQMESLNTALKKGKKRSTHEMGSLGATHRAQEVLNDMIDASYNTKKNPLKPEPTTDTRLLMQVKERLNQILESSGIKKFDASLSKAKSLKTFKEMGYKFKPSETKFENLGLEKLRDKKAFLQGYEQQIKDNVLSDGGTNLAAQVKKGENVFEKLLPKKQFDSLMKKAGELDTEFKRLKSLETQADNKLVKGTQAGTSSWRENFDSLIAPFGRAMDIAEGILKTRSRSNLAKQYLDPNTTQITTIGGLKEALKGIGTASTRQTIFDLLSNGD